MSDDTPGFYRASTLDASPLTFLRPEKSAPWGVHAELVQLRSDLAEAVALLRKCRVPIYYDVEARAEVGEVGPALDSDIGLLERVDALLARHPAPEAR